MVSFSFAWVLLLNYRWVTKCKEKFFFSKTSLCMDAFILPEYLAFSLNNNFAKLSLIPIIRPGFFSVSQTSGPVLKL